MQFEEHKIAIVIFDSDVWTGLTVDSDPDSSSDDSGNDTTWGKFF